METLLVAARTLHFAATISLAGVFAFECLVAPPATQPPKLGRRLSRLAWASLALALVSGAAWLLATAASMSGEGLAAALGQSVWRLVLTQTQFGKDWLLRLAGAAVVALCLTARRRWAAARWAGLLFSAAILAALAWAGHGAATPGAPGDLHLAGDILHLLGAGGWLGALAPFALLLFEVRGMSDAAGKPLAAAAARRFSALAFVSVALLLAGGIINTWFLAGSVPALVGTGYGQLLLAKIALFLATLVIAAVNLLRLTPRLANPEAADSIAARTVAWLRRNALAEATLGLAVLGIVGLLGILPPGSHTEPGWPLAFRIDVAALGPAAKTALALLLAAFSAGSVALVVAAAAGRYRRAAAFAGLLVLGLVLGWLPLRPALERAYPTSFYAPAVPYDAGSIVRGAAVFAANCALCHGKSGEGNGPAAAGLPVRPANLTEPHLFAHTPGDLFWWVGHGRANGAMPGFAAVLKPSRRWDVVNFIRARAAGVLSQEIGGQITATAAPPLPDFAFERGGAQQTLGLLLQRGPVLLILYGPPAPAARLQALAATGKRLAAIPLQIVAAEVATADEKSKPMETAPAPFVVAVAPAVKFALALFRFASDGGETELLLDRNGAIRARWTAAGKSGLPNDATLIVDARKAAETAVAAPNHAGHAQ